MRTDRGEEEQKIWEERAEQSIREERDPWLHEDRSGRGGAENSRGESRAKHSGGERVKFSEIMGVWLQG
jgi:hypothetical protein